MIKMWAGRPDDAINDIETTRYLNPSARMGSALGVIGYSHFFARRFDKAVPNCDRQDRIADTEAVRFGLAAIGQPAPERRHRSVKI